MKKVISSASFGTMQRCKVNIKLFVYCLLSVLSARCHIPRQFLVSPVTVTLNEIVFNNFSRIAEVFNLGNNLFQCYQSIFYCEVWRGDEQRCSCVYLPSKQFLINVIFFEFSTFGSIVKTVT